MLWVRRDGQVFTHTNTRSCKKGRHGDGLNVAWRQATGANGEDDKDSATGQLYTHYGMDEFHDITEKDRKDLTDRIFFARVYGTKPAFGNFGVQDYVFMENVEDGDNWTFKMRVWKNTGAGGSKVIADGNKYGNMQAHEDGRMDYVWTWSHGKMHSESSLYRSAMLTVLLTRSQSSPMPRSSSSSPAATPTGVPRPSCGNRPGSSTAGTST